MLIAVCCPLIALRCLSGVLVSCCRCVLFVGGCFGARCSLFVGCCSFDVGSWLLVVSCVVCVV